MNRPDESTTRPASRVKPLEIGPLRVDPPVLMAPMAGFTDHAFRTMARRFGGVGLPAVEMVSARGFLEIDTRKNHLPDRLWGVEQEPRPLAVQIWDNDPETLARVGARLAHQLQVSVVDVNFGCPVKVVSQRAKSGSYLLKHPDQVGRIVARVVEACGPTPVTAKIRLGPSRDLVNAVDVAQAIEDAGGAAVTVHGRTAAQMYRGRADWEEIARIKPHLARIPLIGNGDLVSPESVVAAFDRYGVDGVMIGRGALGRPWLFRQVQAALAGEPVPPPPAPAEVEQILLEHYRLTVAQYGPRRGTVQMRKVACCYAQGWPGARQFRSAICLARTEEEFLAAVRGHFGETQRTPDVRSG